MVCIMILWNFGFGGFIDLDDFDVVSSVSSKSCYVRWGLDFLLILIQILIIF